MKKNPDQNIRKFFEAFLKRPFLKAHKQTIAENSHRQTFFSDV